MPRVCSCARLEDETLALPALSLLAETRFIIYFGKPADLRKRNRAPSSHGR